jgi:hypothetical protein
MRSPQERPNPRASDVRCSSRSALLGSPSPENETIVLPSCSVTLRATRRASTTRRGSNVVPQGPPLRPESRLPSRPRGGRRPACRRRGESAVNRVRRKRRPTRSRTREAQGRASRPRRARRAGREGEGRQRPASGPDMSPWTTTHGDGGGGRREIDSTLRVSPRDAWRAGREARPSGTRSDVQRTDFSS